MLKITMIIVITFFTIILSPHERASANPLAVGGALYLGGAGVYVLGAVGVGALAGLAGCVSCQEDIEAHAERTWAGTTQLAKDGMQLMVDSAVGAGNAMTATDESFNTWMDSQLDSFLNGVSNIAYEATQPTVAPSLLMFANDTQFDIVRFQGTTSGMAFLANGSTYKYLQVSKTGKSVLEITLTNKVVGEATLTLYNKSASLLTTAEKAVWSSIIATDTPSEFISAVKGAELNGGVIGFSIGSTAAYSQTYANVSSHGREAWQDMRDAGLVLPVDNARPVSNGYPLTYNPDTDAYAGIDGVNVPRENISMEYQSPTWKSYQDLINLGLSGAAAGLYIDGWTGTDSTTSTYDPATDMTTSTTSTTGTTTNVTTGETSTTVTSETTTSTGDTTGETSTTPDGKTPPTQSGKANRWGKLVTTKFPFSLPWDLFFILSFLNADPKTPVFSIDERINKRENVEGIQIKFDIDLSFLDPYVPWFRRFLVLGFALFLILNTRKLLGGAQ